MQRQVIPLSTGFFCDGFWYVITSSSLGGSNLTSETLTEKLRGGTETEVKELLNQEICLPLFFNGDCALDNAIIILGDLTSQETEEWIGRLGWKLKIPCGKLVILCGGADAFELESAISGEEADPDYVFFQAIDVPSGEYLVEVYAYVSSLTVDHYFDEDNPNFSQAEPLLDWFNRTRPNQELPLWLDLFEKQGFVGELSDRLVSYLIRLKPLPEDLDLELPKLVSEVGWCGEFELRRPLLCPLGIWRSQY